MKKHERLLEWFITPKKCETTGNELNLTVSVRTNVLNCIRIFHLFDFSKIVAYISKASNFLGFDFFHDLSEVTGITRNCVKILKLFALGEKQDIIDCHDQRHDQKKSSIIDKTSLIDKSSSRNIKIQSSTCPRVFL